MRATAFTSGIVAPRPALRRCAVPRGQLITTCKLAPLPERTDIEKAAIRRYRGDARNDSKEEALAVLRRAAKTKEVPAEALEGALLLVEEWAHKEDQAPVPSISGRWRLIFGTATKFRPFQYIPVKEDFVLDENTKALALESSIGPFDFYIRGVMNAWKPEEAALDFQFNKVDIHFNGSKVYEVTPKTKPKTYTFYYVGSDIACARSSAGGVALLVK